MSSIDHNPAYNYNYPLGHPNVFTSVGRIVYMSHLKPNRILCIICGKESVIITIDWCKDCFFHCLKCGRYYDKRYFSPFTCMRGHNADYGIYEICHWCFDREFPHDVKEPCEE